MRRGFRLVEHVEMQPRHTMAQQVLHLANGELDTHFRLPIGIVMLAQLVDKVCGQRRRAKRGNPIDLRKVGDGQQPRDDRYVDAQLFTSLTETVNPSGTPDKRGKPIRAASENRRTRLPDSISCRNSSCNFKTNDSSLAFLPDKTGQHGWQ